MIGFRSRGLGLRKATDRATLCRMRGEHQRRSTGPWTRFGRARWLGGAVAALAVACSNPDPDPVASAPTDPEPVAEAPPRYSPFVVEVEGDVPFRRITFKQVGPPLMSVDPSLHFEALAQSLALELSSPARQLSSETRFDPDVQDPNFHLACGSAHIYVDYWNQGSPTEPEYGFSLWSGCSADARFAEDAVNAPTEATLADQVIPLAKRIAERLDQATQSRCFRRSC